jgi:hypothetical protein
MEIHEFDPVIYPYKLWVIVDKKPTDIADKFNEYSGKPIDFIDRDTMGLEAFTMPVARKENPKFGVIIFFRSKKAMSYELVAHESSHAAKFLFEHISADIKEHEPFEYVIGWIAGCCEKVKKNKV